MRFHFGVSFKPTKIIKYIVLGFLGLLAFFGISQVKADSIGYTSIQVNNNSNTTTLFCNSNTSQSCPENYLLPGSEYLGRHFLINFDNTTLTNGHNYTFDIQFDIMHPSSDTAFEQESILIYQVGSSGALIDTPITWNYSTWYDYSYDQFITTYNYSGQFTATSTSSFYVDLKMEYQESFYGVAVGNIHLVDNSSGDELINANYHNTQNIINNANNNTDNIINNQDSNTQEIKDTINNNLQSCRNSLNLYQYDDFSGTINNFYFVVKPLLFGFENNKTYTLTFDVSTSVLPFEVSIGYGNDTSYLVDGPRQTFTTSGRHHITFTTNRTDYSNLWIRIPRYASQTTFTYSVSNIMLTKGNMVLPYEPYGQQICSSKIDNLSDNINNTNQSIQDLNDTISDDTIDTSTSNDFFDNFEDNHHGLSGIVSLPLTTIQSLNNASCTPLTLTIPYLQSNNTLQLPCLTPIYQNNFGVFFTLYQTIIFGFVSYYVCVSIFYMVKDFKDPNKDKIEVMDL